MTLITHLEEADDSAPPVMRAKLRMLEQMAEALEDEAAGLYRRAAVYEEEEFLLAREIEGRQTEINRLSLKLTSLRADHDALIEKITALNGEATALRQQVYCNEEAEVLAVIERAAALTLPPGEAAAAATVKGVTSRSLYFRRAALADVAQE